MNRTRCKDWPKKTACQPRAAVLVCNAWQESKEFVAAVREAGSKAGDNAYTASVDYRHPGLFQAGERQVM